MKRIKRLIRKIQYALRDFFINRKNRARLKNDTFSIICNDCTGGGICHDLKLRFNSPTVNFFFPSADYIVYLTRLKDFLEEYSIVEAEGETYQDHPIANILLKDGTSVKAYLLHYDSVEEFRQKYDERAKRVDRDNLYILFNDRNGFVKEDLVAFDRLPYDKKVCFVHKITEGVGSQYFIPGCEDKEEVEPMMNYIHTFGLKRYYDCFDYVSWLNEGAKKTDEIQE